MFVKSVRCKTGLSDLWDANRGFVKPGNNHHIAIYENEKGELTEVCVTMWEAFERVQQGLSIIAGTHPEFGTLKISIQQNEMFVFDLTEEELNDAIKTNNIKLISNHLYKTQSVSEGYYWFTKHLAAGSISDLKKKTIEMEMKNLFSIRSCSKMNGIKISVDRLGNIKI